MTFDRGKTLDTKLVKKMMPTTIKVFNRYYLEEYLTFSDTKNSELLLSINGLVKALVVLVAIPFVCLLTAFRLLETRIPL